MAGLMWMGPRGHEVWVPAPATSAVFSPLGFTSKTQYLNGGAGVRNSKSTHMEYDMAWNLASRKSLRPISDMFSGVRGPGLIYFVDPMAENQNVLPAAWAFPALACADAIPLTGNVRPTKVATAANQQSFPAESARYRFPAGATSQKLYIPVPPAHTAWVGVQGVTTGPLIAVTPVSGTIVGQTAGITVSSVANPKLFTAKFAGITGIELSFRRGDDTTLAPADYYSSSGENYYPASTTEEYPVAAGNPVATGDYITLSGMIVQILPDGAVPINDGWISGQGNSGCEFESAPTVTAYSAVIPGAEIGMTAKLVETGGWL